QQKRMRIAPQHLKRADGREPIPQKLPIDGNDVGILCRPGKRCKFRKIPPHGLADCSRNWGSIYEGAIGDLRRLQTLNGTKGARRTTKWKKGLPWHGFSTRASDVG